MGDGIISNFFSHASGFFGSFVIIPLFILAIVAIIIKIQAIIDYFHRIVSTLCTLNGVFARRSNLSLIISLIAATVSISDAIYINNKLNNFKSKRNIPTYSQAFTKTSVRDVMEDEIRKCINCGISLSVVRIDDNNANPQAVFDSFITSFNGVIYEMVENERFCKVNEGKDGLNAICNVVLRKGFEPCYNAVNLTINDIKWFDGQKIDEFHVILVSEINEHKMPFLHKISTCVVKRSKFSKATFRVLRDESGVIFVITAAQADGFPEYPHLKNMLLSVENAIKMYYIGK